MENFESDSTEDEMVSEDFRKQVSGYGLTTAHILYRRPDHRWLLQSYVWQNYDLLWATAGDKSCGSASQRSPRQNGLPTN
jgi:hypothetical protein